MSYNSNKVINQFIDADYNNDSLETAIKAYNELTSDEQAVVKDHLYTNCYFGIYEQLKALPKQKTVFEKWNDGEIGQFGSFHTTLLQAYRLADSGNRKALESAFPEWFALPQPEKDIVTVAEIADSYEQFLITFDMLFEDDDCIMENMQETIASAKALIHKAQKQ